MLCNVKQSVLPFIQKLKASKLDRIKRKYVNILKMNLSEIMSPFLHSLTKNIRILTPGEIQIANLLKDGMDAKKTANLLNLSARTIVLCLFEIFQRVFFFIVPHYHGSILGRTGIDISIHSGPFLILPG